MICKICNLDNNVIFSSKMLNKYDVKYFHCSHCGFLQTEEPFWLEEAYDETINISDTGYMQRNLFLTKKMTFLLMLFFNKNGQYLDYAGGYGVFVRLMRDIGFDFYWDDKFTKNIFARGFEYEKAKMIEAITTFESFEHFVNPIEELEKMLYISKNIIFSTELLPSNIPKPKEWWYYGLEHGQHISFYSEKTFKYIAHKYNLHYSNLGSIHILTERKIENFKLKILMLTKFGLHKLLEKRMRSKTWDDYLKVSILK